jgi:hypothetical protein
MITKIRFGLLLVSFLSLLVASPARAVSYTLTVVEQGSGTISTNPTFATYPANVTVGLTATPSAGWYFGGWSGAVTAATNPVNVTMTGDLIVTGLFLAYPSYSLTLTTNGQGGITLNPAGGTYYSNTVVTATATPAAGWVFVDWSDATNAISSAVSLALDSNLTLTGTFAQLPAFDVPPQSITNVVGSTVTFTSHSVGTAPVAYQWYFSDEPITGATNDTLTLADAPATEAGFYQVTATNLYGSVTSSIVSLVLTNASGSTNVVSVCDEAALQAAISAGGWISIGCSGTLTITNTLTISNHVILDGSSVAATLSGGNLVRLFYVQPGASLAITNLTLANGSITNNGSLPADGGAIYNNDGAVTLTGCTLTNNSATANHPATTARGGAIFNNGGTVQIYASAILNSTAFGVGGGQLQPGAMGSGGAIYNTNGNVIVVNSLIQSNLCANESSYDSEYCFGGAFFQASGGFYVTNTTLVGNQASGGQSESDGLATSAFGGALAVLGGHVSLDFCQLVGNTAKGGDGTGDSIAGPAFGGAVYCSNILTAVSCSFNGNSASGGDDSYDFGGPSTAPPAFGGGICNLGRIVLKNCVVSSNDTQGGAPIPYAESTDNGGSGLGGGIYNAGQLVATNCTIALNTAIGSQGQFGQFHEYGTAYCGTALGGGICNSTNGTFVGVNVTVASNICNALGSGVGGFGPYNITTNANGPALGSQIANTNGTASLLNLLIAYGGTNGNAYGVLIDLGDNISSDGSANFESGSSYNFTDPLLGPLANNGGPTLTMALLPDSPAIAYANSDDGAPPDDQRGYARPVGIGVIDLGAYQYGATQISVSPPTLSLSIGRFSTNIVVSFTTSPAITNTLYLQSSTNLINWTDVQTIRAFSSPSNISQTISVQGAAGQFFRLAW